MHQKVTLVRSMLQLWGRSDETHRTVLSTVGSAIYGVMLGIGKLLLGLLAWSPWFIINAIYYLLLSAARGTTVWRYATIHAKQDVAETRQTAREYRACKQGGIFLCLLGAVYLLISIS